ncbi:MAG: DUF3109 family protein [Bacteroidales bacterium]|nr:DUF3109 family protein [Bacteroidales bacterium]
MIEIDNKVVHFDVFRKCFACDIAKCKGICCVEGDSGAPLEKEEEEKLKEILPKIYSRLSDEAKSVIDVNGVSMLDIEGELTTSIIGKAGACVFANRSAEGIIYCEIEKAWEEGLVDFRKPISCHLYPIRVKKYASFEAVNYDVWNICKDAVKLGDERNVKIYEYLKEPLIRKYGEEWYNEMCVAADYVKNIDFGDK